MCASVHETPPRDRRLLLAADDHIFAYIKRVWVYIAENDGWLVREGEAI